MDICHLENQSKGGALGIMTPPFSYKYFRFRAESEFDRFWDKQFYKIWIVAKFTNYNYQNVQDNRRLRITRQPNVPNVHKKVVFAHINVTMEITNIFLPRDIPEIPNISKQFRAHTCNFWIRLKLTVLCVYIWASSGFMELYSMIIVILFVIR